jgi:septal ring factor EnvC (AmiA/AmiB activator)
MAAVNETQGLKIAVATFVSLTVILAVTSYFLYSAYNQTDARLTAAQKTIRTKETAADTAQRQYEEMVKQIGSRAQEFKAVKNEIKAERNKIDAEISGLVQAFNDSIAKAQAAGATGPELQDAKDKLQQISNAYLTEPNKNYLSSMSRLKDQLKDVALIDQEISRNYTTLKRSLESANHVNQAKLDVETKVLADAKADLEAEHKRHAEARESLVTKLDQLGIENAKQATELASLNTKLRDVQDYAKEEKEPQESLLHGLIYSSGKKGEWHIFGPRSRCIIEDYSNPPRYYANSLTFRGVLGNFWVFSLDGFAGPPEFVFQINSNSASYTVWYRENPGKPWVLYDTTGRGPALGNLQ